MRVVEHPRPDLRGLLRKNVRPLVASLLERSRWRHALRGPARWQGKRMPAPVRHRIATERLQTGRVCVEAKLAVAQRNLPRQVVPLDVVPRNQGLPVKSIACGSRRCPCDHNQTQTGPSPASLGLAERSWKTWEAHRFRSASSKPAAGRPRVSLHRLALLNPGGNAGKPLAPIPHGRCFHGEASMFPAAKAVKQRVSDNPIAELA